jgi:hypothetical protein
MATLRLLLIVAVIVMAVMWYRTRDRRALNGLACAVGALALLLAINTLVRLFGMNDDREIKFALNDMAAGVKSHDIEGIFAHVSDSFQLENGTTKPMFREFARARIDSGEVTDLEVWGINDAVVIPAQGDQPATATIHFKVKPKTGSSEPYWECDALFIKDPDGKWRIKSFKLFLPQHRDPYPIPELSH